MQQEKPILKGICASKGIVEGLVHIASDDSLQLPKMSSFILVCKQTNPAYSVLFVKARGVITEVGGVVCHAAILSRELGLPCIVGAVGAVEKLKEGMIVTLNATDGVVYE